MDRIEIAEVLKEIGVLLELKGENPFKCIAYANAARTLEALQEDLGALIREKRLGEIKGIGDALTGKITELYETGHLRYYEELKASFPAGLLECLRVPGLGPKRVKLLWEKLEIDSLGDLRLACERNMVAKLAGFGEKTQTRILEGIANLDRYRGQFLYAEALTTAVPILEILRACRVVKRVEMAGSLRRKKEVVRDLDFVVSTQRPEEVMKIFTSLPGVEKVTSQGRTKSSVILQTGMQADVRCVSDGEFPFALAYFTGSKEHNIALRQRSIDQKKKLNEYGLFQVVRGREKAISCRDEAMLHRKLGLDYIEPELREDMGEIEAAQEGDLPGLVSDRDIRGTFHCHTIWSDGHHSLEDMARAGIAMGWDYMGISDHSKASVVANGLDENRLADQVREIRKLNTRFANEGTAFRLLAGSEVDLMSDGSLDFPDSVLAQLDFTVVSIHQGFMGDERRQTDRVLRAMENRHVTMFGHATGRLLLSREPYKIDLKAVIDGAATTGTMIELNCTPSRMDMDWRWWKRARDRGVLCAINPDAHSVGELDQVSFGVGAARKGWLRPRDVLNTRGPVEVLKLLGRKRGG